MQRRAFCAHSLDLLPAVNELSWERLKETDGTVAVGYRDRVPHGTNCRVAGLLIGYSKVNRYEAEAAQDGGM